MAKSIRGMEKLNSRGERGWSGGVGHETFFFGGDQNGEEEEKKFSLSDVDRPFPPPFFRLPLLSPPYILTNLSPNKKKSGKKSFQLPPAASPINHLCGNLPTSSFSLFSSIFLEPSPFWHEVAIERHFPPGRLFPLSQSPHPTTPMCAEMGKGPSPPSPLLFPAFDSEQEGGRDSSPSSPAS